MPGSRGRTAAIGAVRGPGGRWSHAALLMGAGARTGTRAKPDATFEVCAEVLGRSEDMPCVVLLHELAKGHGQEGLRGNPPKERTSRGSHEGDAVVQQVERWLAAETDGL